MSSTPEYTLDRDPNDRTHWLVLDPTDDPDTRLTGAVETMRETGIADSILRPYARAGLRFFSWYWERSVRSAIPYTPYDPDIQVRALLDEAIRSLNGEIVTGTNEPEIRHINGSDAVLRSVQELVSGTAYLYEGLIKKRHYLFPNPIILPESKRRPAYIPMLGEGRNTRRILTKFYFRTAGVDRPGPRVDNPDVVQRIIAALEAFRRCPKAVIMLTKVAIWGLARLAEQTKLTIWDWWMSSRFGTTILTTNKGRGERRIKEQLLPDELVVELTEWANSDDRRSIDRYDRTLDDWKEFLDDETKTIEIRMSEAKGTPLFPTARKTHYTNSGIRDVWFVPAMRRMGLPTKFHFIRHAGVCDANAMIDSLDVSDAEKNRRKIAFGRQLGWAWPERMVEWYNTSNAKTQEIEIATDWQRDRMAHLRLIASGAAPVRARPAAQVRQCPSDGPLKTLLGFKHGTKRAVLEKAA